MVASKSCSLLTPWHMKPGITAESNSERWSERQERLSSCRKQGPSQKCTNNSMIRIQRRTTMKARALEAEPFLSGAQGTKVFRRLYGRIFGKRKQNSVRYGEREAKTRCKPRATDTDLFVSSPWERRRRGAPSRCGPRVCRQWRYQSNTWDWT